MTWVFPLEHWDGYIPNLSNGHPGAFGAIRKHDIHTGVDLYVKQTNSNTVKSVEAGIVVAIVNFTGPKAESPWWNETKAILIEGKSGVVCYGELEPRETIFLDKEVIAGEILGSIIPVFGKEKIKNEIENHSNLMLHIELYTKGTKEPVWWKLNESQPKNLLDPTINLLNSLTYCQ